nr:PREDICTED: gamma-crystallin N [Apteryx mantelli mantelli]
MSQYSGRVAFYEGKCFTGGKLEVCGACESFQERGFPSRLSSVCVGSGAWICFDRAGFRGRQYALEHGHYPDFHLWSGLSGWAPKTRHPGRVRVPRSTRRGMRCRSLPPAPQPVPALLGFCLKISLQLALSRIPTEQPAESSPEEFTSFHPQGLTWPRLRKCFFFLFLFFFSLKKSTTAHHGEHYRIEIFEGNRFSGRSLEFTEDCSFLQGRGWDKNYVNAIKAYGDGAWVLYEKPSYRGRMYVVERGEFSSCHEWHAQRPNVQSIRRVINYY